MTKVRSEEVQQELRKVAQTSLDDPSSRYGGTGADGLRWRRGVTAATRVQLEAAEAAGRSMDSGQEQAWDYALVFVSKQRIALPDIYVILGVLTEGEVFAEFGRRYA